MELYKILIKSRLVFNLLHIQRASRGAGHKRVTVDETGCGFDSHSRKLNMKCFYFSCYNNEAFSPPLNTQYLQKTLERGERESVLMGMES